MVFELCTFIVRQIQPDRKNVHFRPIFILKKCVSLPHEQSYKACPESKKTPCIYKLRVQGITYKLYLNTDNNINYQGNKTNNRKF